MPVIGIWEGIAKVGKARFKRGLADVLKIELQKIQYIYIYIYIVKSIAILTNKM